MDQVTVSYLAAGFVKNETVYADTLTVHTIGDITVITGSEDDYQFRDVFRIHRKRNVTPPDQSSRPALSVDDRPSLRLRQP